MGLNLGPCSLKAEILPVAPEIEPGILWLEGKGFTNCIGDRSQDLVVERQRSYQMHQGLNKGPSGGKVEILTTAQAIEKGN